MDSLAASFYQAFQKRDGISMGALYGDEAEFSDPVFPSLRNRYGPCGRC